MAFRVQLLLLALCICHGVDANPKQPLTRKVGEKVGKAIYAKASSVYEAVWSKPYRAVRARLSGENSGTFSRRTMSLTNAHHTAMKEPIDLKTVMDTMKADGAMAGMQKLMGQMSRFIQAASVPLDGMLHDELKSSFLGLSSSEYNSVKDHVAVKSWLTTAYKCGFMQMDMGKGVEATSSVVMNQMVKMMLPVANTIEKNFKDWVMEDMGEGMEEEGIDTNKLLSHISIPTLLESLQANAFDQELGKQVAGAVSVALSWLKSQQGEDEGNVMDAMNTVDIDAMIAAMNTTGFLAGMSKMVEAADQQKVDNDEGGLKEMSNGMMEELPIMSSLSEEDRGKGVGATSSKRIMDTMIGNTWDGLPQAIRYTVTDVLDTVVDSLDAEVKREWSNTEDATEWLGMQSVNLKPLVEEMKKPEFRFSASLDRELGKQLASMVESAGSSEKMNGEVKQVLSDMVDDSKFDVSSIRMEDVLPVMKSQGVVKGLDVMVAQIVDVFNSDMSQIETAEEELELALEEALESLYEESDAQWPSDGWLKWADEANTFTCPTKGAGFFGLSGNEGSASVEATGFAEQGNYAEAARSTNPDSMSAVSLATQQFLAPFMAMAWAACAGAMML